ncbi:MAG TPA: AraC family transcriptional regulator [Polyangiaceae bacterium LLY-WYZ-15_(1-7)]|nr:AraC family transcriptional regulator [Myxococcales bacterium]MAT27999.1 AraC family transcriptional regulator [Sandaracinus sp.]HJK91278.1 AraC family transcriptional regulator [Polyangiaceae bacterium LLY-WYZ-15_(1-7)]MBJ70972.1 AraC family transcriptional regulator [Sandaracinus sp.]HJL02795.1 AraC family transcriptional regulator [Polyangiaceae bacterium LLY-WYZ-15_(1-7)]
MGDSDEWRRWFVPGVVPLTVLDIAAERGLSPATLLARANVTVPPSELFEAGLTLGQQADLVEVVAEALGDPRLGFEIGWRLPPTALGSVGYAILSSATVTEALELLQRFWHLVGRATSITLDTAGETGSVTLDVRVPMDAEGTALIKEITLVSMVRGVRGLAPGAEEALEVWFDFPEPPQGAWVRERLGRVRWDMPACQLRFPTALLDTKLPMSNPVGLRAAVAWCEREERLRGMADGRVTARVQSDLQPGPEGYPSLDQMARRLGMAPRTLRRHLGKEGTRYSDLLEAARRRDALRLLDNRALTAQEVAEMLGYRDAANFTRAFRRWTGQTPSQYRAATAEGDDPG